MTTNDGCRADVRKARAEATQPDPTATAVRAAQAEAWDEAVQAVAWCLDSGEPSPAAALAYVAKTNPYRADRLATDTAAPEGPWLDEEYAENLIGFIRTFETGEHAANALPIFLRSVMRPAAPEGGCVPCRVCGGSQTRGWHKHDAAAPVAVEGVETVETLAEADPLADAQGQYANKSIAEIVHDYAVIRGDLSEQYARDQLVRIITARIVQARAGEGALREALAKLQGEWRACAEKDNCWACNDALIDLRAALTTADPS